MNNKNEVHQMMFEKMQVLEKSLRRGIAGIAIEDDWVIICAECGMPKSLILTEKNRSESWL